MSITYKGELEIDHERGVIYFHSSESGASLLRISRLPTPIPEPKPGEALELFVVPEFPREKGQALYSMHINWKEGHNDGKQKVKAASGPDARLGR